MPRKWSVVVGKQIFLIDGPGKFSGTTYDVVIEEK